jgi:hypothetical protein
VLDRARLAVVPVGLEAAVRRLRGHGACDSKPGLELTREMLLTLRAVVEREGAAAGLDVCLDGTAGGMEDWEPEGGDAWPVPPEELTGPAVLGAATTPRAQLRAAGALHTAAGRGTAVVVLPPGDALAPGELLALLHHAWKQTEVARLRLVAPAEPPRQPTLPGL